MPRFLLFGFDSGTTPSVELSLRMECLANGKYQIYYDIFLSEQKFDLLRQAGFFYI